MSRSWQRADDNGYAQWGRVRKARADRNDWKAQVEEAMSGVFVIHNEWEDAHGNVGAALVDGKWYDSEDAALRELRILAESADVEVPEGEYGFTVEGEGTLNYDEYYIQELTRG